MTIEIHELIIPEVKIPTFQDEGDVEENVQLLKQRLDQECSQLIKRETEPDHFDR